MSGVLIPKKDVTVGDVGFSIPVDYELENYVAIPVTHHVQFNNARYSNGENTISLNVFYKVSSPSYEAEPMTLKWKTRILQPKKPVNSILKEME